MSDLPFLVEIVPHDGAWWALFAPAPPPGIEPDMLWDAWDPQAEPASAWTAVGPCDSPRHAAGQAPEGTPWDTFAVAEKAEDASPPAYTAERIRGARPAAPLDPARPDPLEPPPIPADAPRFAFYLADVKDRRVLPKEGLGRETWLRARHDDWDEVIHRRSGLYDDDEAVPATDVWRVDLTHARLRFDRELGGVTLLRPLDGAALTRVTTFPGRPAPGSGGSLAGAVAGAVGGVLGRLRRLAGG